MSEIGQSNLSELQQYLCSMKNRSENVLKYVNEKFAYVE